MNLSKEVGLGLKMLSAEAIYHITAIRFPKDANLNPQDLVLWEMRRVDPEAEATTRALLNCEAAPASSKHRRRRRSRNRRRRKSTKHKDKQSLRDTAKKRRARHMRGETSRSRSPKEVGMEPPRGPQKHPSPAPQHDKSGASSSAAHLDSTSSRESVSGSQEEGECDKDKEDLWAWLMQLDSGRGALEQYFQPLCQEFGHLDAVKAALLLEPSSPSIVDRVDPSFFKALGVASLGHRLCLAKGIVALISK